MIKRWSNFLLLSLPLAFLLLICCHSKRTENVAGQIIDESQMTEAFNTWQVIGEGTEFLTVKIDLPQNLSPDVQFYALILDEEGYPLRKVSGYTYDPQLEGKNHLWFYFFLYAPGQRPSFSNKSGYIKFILMKADNMVMEKIVKYEKSWGEKDRAEIFDLPSPPDQIPGYIVLKDYTFLAKGDFRKPEGYYVEGKIEGSDGHWSHFAASSGIQGKEEEPEYILPVDQGWLELATGKTHSMPEAVAPIPPYVNGWWDGKGYFHPDPLIVYGLKLEK